MAAGALTVHALSNGYAATRALLPGAVLPAQISEPAKPPAAAPPERLGEAEELLEDIADWALTEGFPDLGRVVRRYDDAGPWDILAQLMPDDLFEQLDRWVETRFG
jgi:hypothetical protein